MKKLVTLFVFSLSLLLINACGGGSSSSTPKTNSVKRGSLISATHISTKQNPLFPYRVAAYRLVYNTIDTHNQAVTASGLLTVPKKASNQRSPIISYQHGTIFLDDQAPSVSTSSINGIMLLSGAGYVVSAPDYIGYGESSQLMHPYVHADSLASASVDMLRASKAFLKSKNIKLNSQLFLAGYSEGGYATLALQKKIQDSYRREFDVVASAAGAGPFDLSTTAKVMANRNINNNPSFMSYVLKAYDDIYNLNKVSEMYQSPYIDVINSHFDGQHSGSSIDSQLNHTTSQLFNAPFLSALQGSGSHIIKNKLALNNIYDWQPNAPTRFFHSPNDTIVPYSNAQKALTTMRANHAANVSLVDCSFNSHAACVLPYLLNTRDFFSRYASDL